MAAPASVSRLLTRTTKLKLQKNRDVGCIHIPIALKLAGQADRILIIDILNWNDVYERRNNQNTKKHQSESQPN
jgi:hypothetical protein